MRCGEYITGVDVEDGWNNFVGFGDSDDYVKLSATQPLKLNFSVTSTDNVKLTVYKLTLNNLRTRTMNVVSAIRGFKGSGVKFVVEED